MKNAKKTPPIRLKPRLKNQVENEILDLTAAMAFYGEDDDDDADPSVDPVVAQFGLSQMQNFSNAYIN